MDVLARLDCLYLTLFVSLRQRIKKVLDRRQGIKTTTTATPEKKGGGRATLLPVTPATTRYSILS
jgi:hypothetical protein